METFLQKVGFFKFITLMLMIFPTCTHKYPSSSQRDQKRYRIYIDAGSSGSRLGIYEVTGWAPHLEIRELGSKSTDSGVGIHLLLKDRKQIPAYLDPLFSYAEEFLGKETFDQVPVYIYASGGVRSLGRSDQKIIIKELEGYLGEQKKIKRFWVKVLTGEQEGIFGWMTVNFLQGNFLKGPLHTSGVVDMGGASIQITFVPKDLRNIDEASLIPMKISGNLYQI